MKRHILLTGLVALVFAGVALATPPSPYVAFHQANYNEGTHTKKSHVVWVQVDSVGNGLGTATHAYFSTVQSVDPAGGAACAKHGSNGPDYVTVSNRLLVWNHQGPMMVPVTICGENHSEVVPAGSPSNCPNGEPIGLQLTAFPDGHTHLGLAEATLCIDVEK